MADGKLHIPWWSDKMISSIDDSVILVCAGPVHDVHTKTYIRRGNQTPDWPNDTFLRTYLVLKWHKTILSLSNVVLKLVFRYCHGFFISLIKFILVSRVQVSVFALNLSENQKRYCFPGMSLFLLEKK